MARLFGSNYYNRVKSFRWVHGYSRAGGSDKAYLNDSAGNDKYDAWANVHEATVWEALGDWEGGNMTPGPLSADAGETSSFEAVSAVLLEMYEPERSASDGTKDHETDATAVDWLLMEE